jgi:dUTPase
MLKVKKLHTEARIPTKANPQAVGLDLWCIQPLWHTDEVYCYDTGIAVEPPPGYHAEIIMHSSAAKENIQLINSPIIIDPEYRGSIKVCLNKPINTPFKLIQLILRGNNNHTFVLSFDTV